MSAVIVIVGKVFKIENRKIHENLSCTSVVIPVDSGFGERKITTWWTAKIFGKRGEAALANLAKGDWVCVSGQASVRDGTSKAQPEVDVDSWRKVGQRAAQELADAAPEPEPDPGRTRGQLAPHSTSTGYSSPRRSSWDNPDF
jgi:single-stranded DNA-binding protein